MPAPKPPTPELVERATILRKIAECNRIIQNPGWQWVKERIQGDVQRLKAKANVAQMNGQDRTFLRGVIAGIEMILERPEAEKASWVARLTPEEHLKQYGVPKAVPEEDMEGLE